MFGGAGANDAKEKENSQKLMDSEIEPKTIATDKGSLLQVGLCFVRVLPNLDDYPTQ